MIGIYKFTNPQGKVYIGKSKHIEKRKEDYKGENISQQRKIYYSIKKYGWDKHIFEIIEECLTKDLNRREKYWIRKYNSVKNGLNLTYGGDGGKQSKESKELRRVNSMKPILQYDMQGHFIKEHRGASEAIKEIGRGQANNINDCARGKYRSTYNFQWVYRKKEEDICIKIDPVGPQKKRTKWTDSRRYSFSKNALGVKRSDSFKEKASIIHKKIIYQYDIYNNLQGMFPSFSSLNGSGIIGTTKLRKIINKNIYYKGCKYSYNKLPNE